MPFIDDRMEQNKEVLAAQQYRAKPARAFRFTFDPDKVIDQLKSRIVGQDHIIEVLKDVLFILKADFNRPNRPLAVILLAGPTGVGKTETVKVLTEAILGSADKLCRIDMNTLAQEHYAAALTGSPPGYVGSKEGQTLFDAEKIKGRFSEPGIVLFDEIEKANTDVTRALMNVLDTGRLRLTSGTRELDFQNSLIFMTSNIGAKEIVAEIEKSGKQWRRWFAFKARDKSVVLDQAMSRHFDPEFINRLDRVLIYEALSYDQLSGLINVEISKLNQRLKSCDAACQLEQSVISILSKNYDQRYGARDLIRHLHKELEPKLARALLAYPDESEFIVKVSDEELVVSPA